MAVNEFHIIGAGLVGSLWAYLLRKKGFTVHVYEKRADPRKMAAAHGRSINLIVTSRGLNGLKKAGLAETILPITVPVYGRLMHPLIGETQYQAYGRSNAECNYAVSRGDLNKELIQKCCDVGVEFHFHHELVDMNVDTKCMIFSNNQKADYDCLFATDGAGSVVRKKLSTKHSLDYKEKVDFISSDYKELYLPASKTGAPQLEKNNLHIWPRGTHMLMALANQDNSFTLTLYLPRTNHKWSFDSLLTKQRISELFTSEFKDVIKLVPDFETQFLENPRGSLGTVRFSKWHFENSVALMGDAAHAIVPFFGQGMNSGFEDVSCLYEILEAKNWELGASLEAYSKTRIPNSEAIADMALENFVEMSDKVGDENFLLQKKIESVLEKEFPELYRSRYGMITYTLIPYRTAQEGGFIQSRLLENLASGLKSIEGLDLNHARQQMELEWIPWLRKQDIQLGRFLV